MREDVMRVLYPRLAKGDIEATFKAYCDRSVIGHKILEGVFARTVLDENGVTHFMMDEVEKRTGLLSNIYGCTGVFSLVNRMRVDLTVEQKLALIGTVEWIVDYLRNKGFTLDPYYNDKDPQDKDALFNVKRPFIGTMTWSLSLLVNVRSALRGGELNIEVCDGSDGRETVTQEQVTRMSNTVNRIKGRIDNLIVNIIKSFNDYSVSDRTSSGSDFMSVGWSFSKECDQPSLFYTYSVLEAYSDFEDTVFPRVNEEGETTFAGDPELLDFIGRDVIDEFRTRCFTSAQYVWNRAKKYLKEAFIGDNFFERTADVSVTEAEILKSPTSNALFNTLFVVFTAIYGYVNKKGNDKNTEDDEEVTSLMREALQNVQVAYEALEKEGKDYIVDNYSLLFKTVHRDADRGRLYSSKLNSERIFDLSLVPILVKSNSMMAFYIQQYPQKQMGTLFDLLFEKLSDTDRGWVWDTNRYNVKNTERYLEAIADFFDYYEKYELDFVKKKNEVKDKTAEELRKREPRLRREIKSELDELYRSDTAAKIEQVRSEYRFENLFNELVEEKAREVAEQTILHSFDRIIEAHATKNKSKLTEFDKALEEKLKQVAVSYLDSYLHPFTSFSSVSELEKKMGEDISSFATEYAKRVATPGSKDVLVGSVFDESKGEN